MKYIIILTVIIFSILIAFTIKEINTNSHSPKFSEKGELLVSKLRNYEKCYNVSYPNSIMIKGKSKLLKPSITISLYDCQGDINFKSINKNDSMLVMRIANLFFKECINSEEFDGIDIQIIDGIDIFANRKTFYYKSDNNGMLKFKRYYSLNKSIDKSVVKINLLDN